MLLSAVTLSFQFVCSKFVAKNNSLAAKAAVYSVLHRRSWQAGAIIGTALGVASPAISRYLNLPGNMLIILLAIGTASIFRSESDADCCRGCTIFGGLVSTSFLKWW